MRTAFEPRCVLCSAPGRITKHVAVCGACALLVKGAAVAEIRETLRDIEWIIARRERIQKGGAK